MMLNLFSIFDFYTFFFSNWISTVLGVLILVQIYWLMFSRFYMFMIKFLSILCNEFNVVLKQNFNIFNLYFYIILFVFIMFNNFMGLFPYIFTSSSHLMYSMIFSFSMWMGLMLFGWINNMKFMLIHLVPQSTPFILMFFMVIIELLSNLMRPLTLCIRLTANMIAGHLLLSLLSMFMPNFGMIFIFMLMAQMMLLFLEIAVSLIQAYVFVVLMILYLKETN